MALDREELKKLLKEKGDIMTPYAVHPVSVAMLLSRYTDDEDVLIAG